MVRSNTQKANNENNCGEPPKEISSYWLLVWEAALFEELTAQNEHK